MAKKTTKKSTPTTKKQSSARKTAKPTVKTPAKKVSRSSRSSSTSNKTPKKATKPVSAAKPTRKKAKAPAPVLETKPVAKPVRNQAGLTAKELEHYRALLLEKRHELLGDVDSMEDEALRNSGTNLSNLPIHMADMGTDNYEQEFTLGLVEQDRRVLRDINLALAKIQNGTYGICEGTGKPISKPRLEVQPWTRYSIEHARKLEQRVRHG